MACAYMLGNYWSDILCPLFHLPDAIESDESQTIQGPGASPVNGHALGIMKGSVAIKNRLLGALFFVIPLYPAYHKCVGIRYIDYPNCLRRAYPAIPLSKSRHAKKKRQF